MPDTVVGNIVDLDSYRRSDISRRIGPKRYDCPNCARYRRAIREYLADYTSRNVNQESIALAKLRAVLGE
jgi:hypothetical protein